MYTQNKYQETSIEKNESSEGETIEQKVARIVNNKEPITDGAPIIYTERTEGVKGDYNIRTDRFEIAVEAMDKVTATHRGKRQEAIDSRKKIIEDFNEKTKQDGKTEPTQGTSESAD